MEISNATEKYNNQPLVEKENRYAIKNSNVSANPITISNGPVDLNIKKKGKMQKTIQA